MAKDTKPREDGKKAGTGKNRKLTVILILLIVLLLAVIALLIWQPWEEKFNDEDFFDPMAVTGILPNMSESEIQVELNRVVEEGMLNISIAGEIYFPDAASEGKANISNLEINRYITRVNITLDEGGESVYESGGIRPGQYIQFIRLSSPLNPGEYPATATFTAYTLDSHQIVGRAATKITLHVLG